MSVYADSSFVVSLYAPDSNSTVAIAIALEQPEAVIVSSLALLEVTNALELRIFRGQATRQNSSKASEDFHADIERGIFRLLTIPPSAWSAARKLSQTHSAKLGVRALDILQVSIAISLRATAFLTFDRNQAALARAEGLEIPIQ